MHSTTKERPVGCNSTERVCIILAFLQSGALLPLYLPINSNPKRLTASEIFILQLLDRNRSEAQNSKIMN